MIFEIETPQKAKLASVNLRSELHGKEHIPAVDLRFTLDMANDVLTCFDGALKSALYSKATKADAQAPLEGVPPVSDLPNLRFPSMKPIAWDHEQTGATLRIDYGLGGASDLVLEGCVVNAFDLEPKQGGTVAVKFRVQCNQNLQEATMGKLGTLVQHDVQIVLQAAEVAP